MSSIVANDNVITVFTGILTGSVSNQRSLTKEHPFKGQGVRNRSVVVLKTHEYGNDARNTVSLIQYDYSWCFKTQYNYRYHI